MKGTVLSSLCIFGIFVKNYKYMNSCPGFLSCSLVGVSVLYQDLAALITIALHYTLKLESMMPPHLLSLLKIILASQVLLWIHVNVRQFFTSMKNASGILIEMVLNWYVLGQCGHLTIFCLSIHEHGIYFHIICVFSISFFFKKLFIYSHVHALFGSFLPPCPSLPPAPHLPYLISRQNLFYPYL
jgi:hypothetical protein